MKFKHFRPHTISTNVRISSFLLSIVLFIVSLSTHALVFSEVSDFKISTEDPAIQTAALWEIYTSLDGNFWNSNSNWGFGNSCFWFGITCNSSGQVTSVNLSDNNLSGELGEDNGFCMLPFLTELDISDNNITGVLPSCLFTSDKVELFFQDNDFSGVLPSSITSVQATIDIDIHGSQLTGCYPNLFNPRCNSSDFSNSNISNGNSFDATWDDYCLSGDGVCCETNYTLDLNTIESGTYYSSGNIEIAGVLNGSKSITLKTDSVSYDGSAPVTVTGSIEIDDEGCN